METILIVEDDASRLIALALILRAYGYGVLEAGNENEAAHHCLEHRGPIYALLTDFELDGTDGGPRLAERLLALSPEMQVIFMFHSPPNQLLDTGWLPWGCTLLERPFSPDVLARAVQNLQQHPSITRTDLQTEHKVMIKVW